MSSIVKRIVETEANSCLQWPNRANTEKCQSFVKESTCSFLITKKIKSVSNTRNLSIFGSVLCGKEVVCDTENYRSFTSLFVTGEMVLFASDVQRAPVIVVTPTVASQLFNFAEQPLSVQVSKNIITRAHNKLIQTLSWKLWNGGVGVEKG